MSRRESYKAPLHRSKFMVDYWLGIYQLKQIFVQRAKDLEKGILIPEFFSPTSGDSSDRRIDGVDIYDVETSTANMKTLKDGVIPEYYSQLLSAVQLQHSLRAAIKANLMTTRVTGYIKKKTFSSFLNKSKGAAQLTTGTKLVPDVTSLEYQVCHAVLYMLQREFEEVVVLVIDKITRTMEHIKGILCVTLQEVDPSLTFEELDESGLFLWSNPSFLTNWGAFVTSLYRKEDEVGDATASQDAKKKSVFKKIRKSVAKSIASPSSKKAASAIEKAQHTLYTHVMSLAPLHTAYLQIMEQLSTPTSSCYFQNLTLSSSDNGANRCRCLSDGSSESTEEYIPKKWYFGKLVGRKAPNVRRRSESESSTGDSVAGSDNDSDYDNGDSEDFLSGYAKAYGIVFVTEEENSAVEIDHRLIHSVVNEAPPVLPGCPEEGGEQNCDNNFNINNNTDVRLFSWYMYVVMHNSHCVAEKLRTIYGLHEALNASGDKDTDKRCLSEYALVGKEMMANVVSTTQIIRSLRDLFSEEDTGQERNTSTDTAPTAVMTSYKQTLQHLCQYVTHHWLKEVQRIHSAVQLFMAMRRENVTTMIKQAMPICSEEEVEAIVTHDDGVHVHKLIAAVNNGHSEVARMLEARLRGPPSGLYSDMQVIRDQVTQVLDSVGLLLESPLKHLRC